MIGRLGVRLVAGLALLALVAGVPAMLATLIGWPLPTDLPSWDELTVTLTSPPTERLVMNTLAVIAWAAWVGFVTSLAGEAAAIARHGLADRNALPAGRNPARMVALVLFTALATGGVGHTAATATAHSPPAVAAVELTADQAPPDAGGASTAPAASSTVSGAAPQSEPRSGYLWEDPPQVLPDGHSGTIAVDVAGQHHQYRVETGATLWDLAETWLGDPRRWVEVRDLNPHWDGHPAEGDDRPVLRLPDDATSPAAASTSAADEQPPGSEEDPAVELTYEVARGDWMWHIAGRYLGDEQRYPEIAALNPELAERYPGFPDHIQPGDQLQLPPDADDRGERRHATGDADQPSSQTGQPSAPPARPAPPAEPPPTPTPTPPAPPLPPATTATPADPPSATTSPPAPADTQTEPPHGTAQPDHPDDQPGVALPTGSWISLGLAALVATLAAVLRLHRRRRARLAFPIRARTGPADSPVPEALRDAEAAGQAQLDLDNEADQELAGILPDPPTTPAAVAINQQGDPLGAFELPGDLIQLHGPGAQPAARAVLAAACAAGVAEHPLARPQVVTTTDTLALLLPGVPARGLDPHGETFDGEHLHVMPSVAAAVERAEQEMVTRWRHLDEHDVETVAELNAGEDHAEHLPPLLLLLAGDPGRHRPRIQSLGACRTSLAIHVILLDTDAESGVRVDTDGTIAADDHQPETTTGDVRLSTLTAGELAGLLDMVRHAQPRPDPDPPPAPEPVETAPTSTAPAPVDVPRPTADHQPPVRLQVLGPVTLATATGPITSGVRARAYAVLALLASHPAGRSLEQLADDLNPAAKLDIRAALRADINSVRATLRKTTGITGKYVVHDQATGHYKIDPELIDVDLWRMLAAIDAANQTADDDTACLAALRQAADNYRGDFAASLDQPVFTDHATTYRHQILSAYGKIAEIVELDNPDQAVEVLEKAAALDPVNEELAQRIMRIHGRAGRPEQVRRTLSRLEARLAEIGQAEPSAATRRVAQRQLAAAAEPGPTGQPATSPAARATA